VTGVSETRKNKKKATGTPNLPRKEQKGGGEKRNGPRKRSTGGSGVDLPEKKNNNGMTREKREYPKQ